MRKAVEFIFVWLLVKLFSLFPRDLGRQLGAAVGAFAFRAIPRLRRVGLRNLELAFPSLKESEREKILRVLYRNFGWQLAEFCKMPGYTPQNTAQIIRY